ncbi:DNA repair protein XRCC2 [Neosynchiropus ocellatus]
MTENGVQLLARLDACPALRDVEPRLFCEDGPGDVGEVVEVYGPEGTGKTELLYHLLCRCVSPLSSGGLEVEVLFVDTDYSLDLLRLVHVMDHRLSSACSDSGASYESVLRACLSRLLVVHCSSSSQLLLTLHYMETSLSTRPCLLFIDSISAFYWPDRSVGSARQDKTLGSCAELLGRLLRDYKTKVVASCRPIRRASEHSASHDSDGAFLCRPWQQLVSRRLMCSRQEPSAAGARSGERNPVFSIRCCSATSACRSLSFRVTDRGLEFL